jgi:acyl dehydratase
MRYFEYYELGREVEIEGKYLITEEEIMEIGNRWDPQPFHTDIQAAKESHFGGLIASSVHLIAVAVSLATGVKDEDKAAAISSMGFNNMRQLTPARPGDELSLRCKVLEQRLSKSKPNLGIINFGAEVFNQKNEIVFQYENAALVKCKP